MIQRCQIRKVKAKQITLNQNLIKNGQIVKSILLNAKHRIENNKLDTWDYQFFYTRLINDGFSLIRGKFNKNIDSPPDATHTKKKNKANYELVITKFLFP